MNVSRHHYDPTPEQQKAIKLARTRIQMKLLRRRAMNSVRTAQPEVQKAARNLLTAIFADLQPAVDPLPGLRDDFMAHGWSESAAGELADIHVRLHGQQA